MCRHLAYLGAPRSLQSLVIDPPHSLYEQSWGCLQTIGKFDFGVSISSRRTSSSLRPSRERPTS